MKNYIFKTIIWLAAIIMVTGCEQELITFDTSMKVVGASSSSVVIKEDAGTGNVNIYLGAEAGATAEVSFTVSTEGLSSPAIEGTHYTISGTSISAVTGETPIVVTVLDNDVFGGDKQFRITINEGTGYTLSTSTTVLVTISDNEHPLKQWIGTYDVAAPSFTVPGAWDEVWTVTTSPVDGHPDQLQLDGVGLNGTGLIATFDVDAMTITIEPGQDIGLAYADWGYTEVGVDEITVFFGYEDLTYETDADLVGAILANGDMTIDGWCHIQDGGVWDVFDTTWTKQ